jgi:voltage-gated potassium channel
MDIATRRKVSRAVVRCTCILGGLLVAYAFLPLRGRWWWVGALIGSAAIIALLPITVRRIRALVTSDQPMVDVAEGLVTLLGILVTGFAALYYGMNRNGTQFHGLVDRVDSIYFTVTTLSTVGFGDISASGDAARIIVTVQMLFDLVYIGLTVRVLTSVARRRAGGRPLVDDDL